MDNKWNTTDIEKISKAFTQKTIEKCFQDNLKISGDEIVTATDFPQINYFILREIFNRWTESTEKFKSPYFDFEADEVVKSFSDFKNTLSRNISVSKEHFTQLLEGATAKTLELYFNAETFFIADFRNLPDFKLTQDWLKRNIVFFKEYNFVLTELGDLFSDATQWVYANQALDEVKNILKSKPVDLYDQVEAIAEAAGLQREVIVETKKAPEDDNLSFFDRLVANPPKPTQSYTEREVSPFERLVEKAESKKETLIIKEEAIKEPVKEEVVVEEKPTYIAAQVPAYTTSAPAVAEETKSAFDGLNIPTLNDKLNSGEGNSLSDVQQRSKIDSLKSSMSLNQRFSFVSSLFGNSLESFETAVTEIDNSRNFDEAKSVLSDKYSARFGWNTQSEEYTEFLQLVKRRFS